MFRINNLSKRLKQVVKQYRPKKEVVNIVGPQGFKSNLGSVRYTIRNNAEFEEAHVFVHELLDIGAYNEKHKLSPLLDIIGEAIYQYEQHEEALTSRNLNNDKQVK